ncbi:hypothetical protein [Streptomyces goshikiensis]|uniref:hypothetical protein n=1 Tax=Streptomyces goshikiensis TaxID=1942 RepID=UPI003666532B
MSSARLADGGGWAVTSAGPRDLREEIQHTAALWKAAGSPVTYVLRFGPDQQQLTAGSGRHTITWTLPSTSAPAAPLKEAR